MLTQLLTAGRFVLLLFLGTAFIVPTVAQMISFDMKLILVPSLADGATVTVTLAGQTVTASSGGGSLNCGPEVESESTTVTLEYGKPYELKMTTVGGASCANTRVEFSGLADVCLGVRYSINGSFLDSILDNDGTGQGVSLYWSVLITTNKGTIRIDTPCDQGLPADEFSTATATLENSTLTGGVTWSVEPPTLNCVIVSNTATGCIIRAGDTNGTVYIRATDPLTGCFVRVPLDLYDPNEGGCSSGCSPNQQFGDGSSGLGSIHVSLALGLSADGRDAGHLEMLAEEPSLDNYTPKQLVYRWKRPDVDLFKDTNGYLRQIKAAHGLADIVVSNSSAYRVNFYQPGQFGSKTTNGYPLIGSPSPSSVWLFENPDSSNSNRLRVTHTPLNEDSVVHEYRWLTNGWELSSADGLRVETKTSTNIVDVGINDRLEIATIREGTNGIVYQHTKRFQIDGPDDWLIEETWGTGANARTNTYTPDWNAYGQPGKHTRWDGSWNWYQYDSNRRVVTNFSSYLNQTITNDPSLCRMTIYDYSTNILSGSGDAGTVSYFKPRSETDYVLGQAVSKKYWLYLPGETREIRCASTSAAWNDANNLVTTTKTYTNTLFAGRLKSVKHPDGTMDIYYYTTADYTSSATTNQQNVTNIVMSGKPDGYETNIVEGTKTTTIVGPLGQTYSRTTVDIESQIVIDLETQGEFDDYARPRKITYLDGTSSYTDYSCCGAQTVTNREGIVTTYTRDALKRAVSTTVTTGAGSITTSNHYDAAGNVVAVTRTAGGATVTNASASYDLAGRKLTTGDGLGNITHYSESLAPLVTTTTHADTGVRIETRFRDGSTASVTGNAAFPVRYAYAVNSGAISTTEIKLDATGSDTSEAVTNFFDAFGRNYKTVHAGGGTQESFYNSKGQLGKVVDPDGIITLYTNDARGQLAYTCIDYNQNSIIDFNDEDRITQVTNDVLAAHGTNVLRTRTYAWLTNNSTTATLISTAERSVEGFKTWTDVGGAVSTSVKTLPSAGSYTVTQTAPDGSYSIAWYQNGRVASVTRYNSGGTSIGSSTYGYDAHGRQNRVTDARTGTTTFAFNNADQIVSVTTPPPGTGGTAQTTTTTFDAMGRATTIVQADGTSVNNIFSKRGEILLTSGSRNYPVGYSYDAQGRMTAMTNWSAFSSGAGARVTSWYYHPERGWLTNKLYADSKGTKYSYTAAGRLSTRLWSRGTNTTYAYNTFGDLSSLTYDDGSTPTVSYTYTRRGQRETITRGSDSWTMFYSTNGLLMSEAGTAGTLSGLRVTNAYDQYLRRTNVSSANGATLLTTNGYTFDTAGRLSTARDGTFIANYSYLANSPLVSQIAHSSNGTTRLTTTKTYDNLNRLQSITSTTNGASISVAGYTYSYNDANQRTRANLADGSFWIYDYDSLGQVKSGKRYWSDWTPVAGQQFEYSFDDIGNRNSTKNGGDSTGGHLRSASYTNNTLNQITGRDVPAYLNVIGAASATATNVNVNNTHAYRKGEYYRVELNPDNTSAAVWQSVTNRVVQNGTTNSVTGNLFLPKQAEVFSYDADGNLTNDGRWSYRWDAENRLISMSTPTTAPSGSRKSLTFDYDPQGRRISKVVRNWTGSTWAKVIDEKYLYDGWNQLTTLNASNTTVVRAFLWGSDLSGSMQGAGGVGGLLAVNAKGSGVAFVACDGNGNVTALVDAALGNTVANYDYGPFGEVLRASGTLAKLNPFRFSTKFQDEETDHLYYGYRYYSQSTGRWPSRDPIGEFGRDGGNVYAFVRCKPISSIDPFGKESFDMFANDVGIPVVAPSYCAAWQSLRFALPSTRYNNQYMPEFTSWYETRFPKTAEFAQKSFKRKLDEFFAKNCNPNSLFPTPDVGSIDIFGYGTGERRVAAKSISEEKFGDRPQTANEAILVLGNHYMEVRDLDVQTRICCGCRFYSWTANVVVIDGLGIAPSNAGVDEKNPGEDILNLWFYNVAEPFFPERQAVIAEWQISGGGKCCSKSKR